MNPVLPLDQISWMKIMYVGSRGLKGADTLMFGVSKGPFDEEKFLG